MRASSTPAWLSGGLQPRAVLGVTRSRSDRVVAGVAGGIGDRLRVDPVFVRLGFVALTAAGGFGLAFYLLSWAMLAEQTADHATPPRTVADPRRTLGFGLIVLGLLVLLRDVDVWFSDPLSWPVALAAFGSAVIWVRGDGAVLLQGRLTGGWRTKARVAVGAVLVVVSMGAFLSAIGALPRSGGAIVLIVVTVGGLGLILAPSIWQLARQATDERRERIRSEERAEVAAHLHDSVLQTLAMIQRSNEVGEMVALARGQERELRAWLYGRTGRGGAGSFSGALNQLAGRMERLHHVPVEVVLVGDVETSPATHALLEACGEAVHNAARHSGAALVSVYVEIEPRAITAYVRDEGKGFLLADVPPDRHGIADSIVGRMQRHGGRATLTSEPGEGTEVELWLPLP